MDMPITVLKMSLSDVISFQASKECDMSPVWKVSQRLWRWGRSVVSIKKGKSLTQLFSWVMSCVISSGLSFGCCCTSSVRLHGDLSQKNAAGMQTHFLLKALWHSLGHDRHEDSRWIGLQLCFDEPTAFPIRFVSLASLICLAGSWPKRYLVDAVKTKSVVRWLKGWLKLFPP